MRAQPVGILSLRQVQAGAYSTSAEHGFHHAQSTLPPQDHARNTRLLLIITEVAEAVKPLRRVNPHAPGSTEYAEFEARTRREYAEELADIIIRTLDNAAADGIDLESILLEKMEANRERPHLHNRRF